MLVVREQQLLVLLFVLEADLDERSERLGLGPGRTPQQALHLLAQPFRQTPNLCISSEEIRRCVLLVRTRRERGLSRQPLNVRPDGAGLNPVGLSRAEAEESFPA